RTAFVADKLSVYSELVRLCLADPGGPRITEAFGYVERARSRALVDLLGGAIGSCPQPRDEIEASLLERLAALGQELNWFYSQILRQLDCGVPRGADSQVLQDAARERERTIADVLRQLQNRGGTLGSWIEPVRTLELQDRLG